MRLSRYFVFHHLDKITAEYRFYGDKGMQLSHNLKYEYNPALAKMFEKAMPYINGRAWLHFLDQGMVGRLKQEQKKTLLELNRLQKKHAELYAAHERNSMWGHGLQAELEALQRGHNVLVKAHGECSEWGHGLQAELEALQRDHNVLVKAHGECSEWGHGLQAELEALQRDHNAWQAHGECSEWGHGLQAELEALQRDHCCSVGMGEWPAV